MRALLPLFLLLPATPAHASPAHAPPVGTSSVEALPAEAPPAHVPELRARGVLEASRSAEVAAPMAARLLSVPLEEGARFQRGAVLARFDCAALRAEQEARKAAHATLTLRHGNQSELWQSGAAGQLDVQLAESEMKQAASEARALAAKLRDCTVHAPWAGRVAARHMESFETPSVGQPILSIVGAGRGRITLIVPSAWSAWLETGAALTFTVDETRETFPASVARLGAVVDPTSQTMEVVAEPEGAVRAVPGMSGTAVFAAPAASEPGQQG